MSTCGKWKWNLLQVHTIGRGSFPTRLNVWFMCQNVRLLIIKQIDSPKSHGPSSVKNLGRSTNIEAYIHQLTGSSSFTVQTSNPLLLPKTCRFVQREVYFQKNQIDVGKKPRPGHFRVPPGLCFKTRVGAQPLIWKSFFMILMQIKLIFSRQVVHLASFWKWGFLELGNGLFSFTRARTLWSWGESGRALHTTLTFSSAVSHTPCLRRRSIKTTLCILKRHLCHKDLHPFL